MKKRFSRMNAGMAGMFFGTIVVALLVGCETTPPPTFVRVMDTAQSGWKSIELREGLDYDQAWEGLVDVVALKLNIETMDKDAGYLRSGWAYMSGSDRGTGRPFTYGRRLTAKFSEDRETLMVKTDAYYEVLQYPTVWGLDTAFNDDVYTEIAGRLGRTGK